MISHRVAGISRRRAHFASDEFASPPVNRMHIVSRPEQLVPFHGNICVPTMGALHAGHVALIERAVTLAAGRPVVVTIFVNPTQFGPSEDFNRYPRTFSADVERCRRAGADVVFAPEIGTIYPDWPNVKPHAGGPLPAVAEQPGLEDRFRPGHFAGVCRVVRRLFDLLQPTAAVFGEKDYQQCCVIRSMAEMDHRPIEIVLHPTVRDPDGLAMSSRNRYLSANDRATALAISRALFDAQATESPAKAESAMHAVLSAERDLVVEYAVVRDAGTLLPVSEPRRLFAEDRPARALVAARVGGTRLIDNVAIGV